MSVKQNMTKSLLEKAPLANKNTHKNRIQKRNEDPKHCRKETIHFTMQDKALNIKSKTKTKNKKER